MNPVGLSSPQSCGGLGASASPNHIVLLVLQSSGLSCLRILLVSTEYLEMGRNKCIFQISLISYRGGTLSACNVRGCEPNRLVTGND